jgi:hypothetical protein
MIVWTEETERLAETNADVGAALATGRRRSASERTLMRDGQLAVTNAAAEIGKLRQELAA